MPLITRTAKGSKLTIAEMDGNLTYLASSSFQDGVYSQTVEGTGAVIRIGGGPAASGSEGVYEDISPTGGSGTGLVVDIEIANTGKGLAAEFIIVNGGTGYEYNEKITVQNTDIGGVSGTTNFVISEVNTTKTSTITVTEDEISLSTTEIIFSNLPTSDPSRSGQLWNDSGSLKISAGAAGVK
jgi:hypothetical protein